MKNLDVDYNKLLNKEFLEEKYINQKLTAEKISKELGISIQTVIRYLRKNDFYIEQSPRKYYPNHNYFKILDWERFYILGFLMADGNISKRRKCLGVDLSVNDIEIIHFIRNKLSPDVPIRYRTKKSKKNISHTCSIQIYSEIIVNDLVKWNIVPAKTGFEILPEIPEEYRFDYLRGLFDGDGCFSINKQGLGGRIRIASKSKSFLEQVQNQLCYGYGHIEQHVKIYWLYCISKKSDLLDISTKMYKDNNFCLQRKYDRFLQWKQNNGFE